MLENTKRYVLKRDGMRKEEYNEDKIREVLNNTILATDDGTARALEGVSIDELLAEVRLDDYLNASLDENGNHDPNKVLKTSDIHAMVISKAAEKISEEAPDYQYMAGRLLIFQLRKFAYGRYQPRSLLEQITTMVEKGKYDAMILEKYAPDEINQIDSFINHNRDLNLSYIAAKIMQDKYLLRDRSEDNDQKTHIYETPQFLFALVPMCLFADYPRATRLDYVRRYYDAVSQFRLSLPTPIMAGVRTPTRQFSSCVLIECDDSLNSINASAASIVKYVSQRAGIGLNVGRIRALGSAIRGGIAKHTGCIPFYQLFQAAVRSCSQGGVRNGAATLFFPIWHREAESLIVLRNNRGTEHNRVRHVDYGVQINKYFYRRLQEDQNITLFSPHDVKDLYEAFFADQEQFATLYEHYEQVLPESKKKTIAARELFRILMLNRYETGRVYIQHVDHCNTHGAFDPAVAPIRQSNLCMEITLPTKPLNDINDENGEIALCTLSSVNLGTLNHLDDLEELADLAVRSLDALLDYQDYPVKAAELSTMNRRSLGIGVINYAYYLAKNGLYYTNGSALALTHRTFEALQFYLLKASMNLAKEKGACPAFNQTKYAQGILPIDTYSKAVDSYCSEPLHLDWEGLRRDILKYGLRNSTLTSLMPSETSSQISNATNGIEPPRGVVSLKQSDGTILRQLVPESSRLKNNYQFLWDMRTPDGRLDNDGYLKLVGVMQKFVDQSISVNTNYDAYDFDNNNLPLRVVLKDLLNAYRYGVKTLYYQNTRDHNNYAQEGEVEFGVNEEDACAGGACKI